MTCCGGVRRSSMQGAVSQARGDAAVWFESQNASPVTLFGRTTGMRYHFPGVGARVRVDVRDAPTFDVVRGIRRVG